MWAKSPRYSIHCLSELSDTTQSDTEECLNPPAARCSTRAVNALSIFICFHCQPAKAEEGLQLVKACVVFSNLQLDDVGVSKQFEILDLSFNLPHDIETTNLLSV